MCATDPKSVSPFLRGMRARTCLAEVGPVPISDSSTRSALAENDVHLCPHVLRGTAVHVALELRRSVTAECVVRQIRVAPPDLHVAVARVVDDPALGATVGPHRLRAEAAGTVGPDRRAWQSRPGALADSP